MSAIEDLDLKRVKPRGLGGAQVPEGQVTVDNQSITLPSWIADEFGGRESGKANVLQNEDEKVIAVKSNKNGDFSTKYNRVNCSSTLKAMGIDHEDKRRYEAEYDEDEGLLLVHLDKPVE